MGARAPVRLSGAQKLAPRIDKKLLRFLESVPDAMILSDQKGRIVFANSNTERMFGYSPNELVGKEVEILVPERFRASHREDRATYYANPTKRRMAVGRDLYACSKDGEELSVEISLAPVEILGKTLVLTAIRDVGERERSITQIREAMQKKGLFLGGMISICAWCKKVQDEGIWLPVEKYIESHSQVKFSHGICKDCIGRVNLAGQKPEFASHKSPPEERSAEGGSSITKRPQEKRYMIVEHIKDAAAVYQRLWERGRMLPSGVVLESAWFDEKVERGYRLMQTHDRRLLDEWMANWSDLIELEVCPVITPEEAGERVAARMRWSPSCRAAGLV